MGYATNYKVSTQGKDFTEKGKNEINKLIGEALKLPADLKDVALKGIELKKGTLPVSARFLISDRVGYDPFESECKWYEHEEDMKKVSKEYPETIFVLEGDGEESGDIWKKYFMNGKMQSCKAIMTFENFDESKLK